MNVAELALIAVLVGRLLVAVALAWALVATYRWIQRSSPTLGAVFAAGVVIRAATGLALFLISVFELPIFRSLQLGDGFWALALDGRTYYDVASHAVAQGLGTISDTSPSPMYLRTLAIWMWAFGVSPASALLLNVACYAISAALIVLIADIGHPTRSANLTGTIVALTAVTFSPALIIFGTQPLKDALCTMLMILVIAGVRVWWTTPREDRAHPVARVASGVLLMAVGIYGVAGIRAYVALFLVIAVAVAGAYSVVFGAGVRSRSREALRHSALLVLLWTMIAVGAPPYAESYQSLILSLVQVPSTSVVALDSARGGFLLAGGATSLEQAATVPPREKTNTVPAMTTDGRLGSLLRGLTVMLVPISILRATYVVEFPGGEGLLWITDLDTVVIDVTVVASLCLFVVSARRHRISPDTAFVLVLAVLIAVSMAYVVTNYGTLFRLRLLAVAPLWMLPVMLPSSQPARHKRSECT